VCSSDLIAIYPEAGREIDALLASAGAAMHHAKEAGGNRYRFHTAEMEQVAGAGGMTETHLRRALVNGELEVHFQPKISLLDGRLVGIEALARWCDPQRGQVSPTEFIPIAERSFLIAEIGRWVLGESCRALARLHAAGARNLHVAVNVSAMQFARQDLLREVDEALASAGLPPSALQIELTESLFVRDANRVSHILKQLSDRGVQLALDDFGSGYASLAYLRALPFHLIKIDRDFIRNVHSNRYHGALARAAINLAEGMDLQVVAEGIEGNEQQHFLADLGCHYGQGYLFARPMRERNLTAWMRGRGGAFEAAL
jgi:EAL domain-containing protein (putative c-di-GMP-specific phosphodiesterase class I)